MYIPIDLSKYYNHIIYKNEVIERDIYLNKKLYMEFHMLIIFMLLTRNWMTEMFLE